MSKQKNHSSDKDKLHAGKQQHTKETIGEHRSIRNKKMGEKSERQKVKYKIGIMAILLAGACILIYYYHVVHGICTVSTHFFYIPIILAAIWWKRKGLVVAVILSALLVSSYILFRPEIATANVYLRAFMFIVIAVVVVTLSERIVKDEEFLRVKVTECVKAEEKLKQTAEEWITTFDSITDMVSIHDKDFKIVRANKSFANVFKMKPSEIIGKTCYKLIHGTKEPPPFCPHRQTIDNGKPNRAEFFDPHLGIHVEASTSPIFDENGQVMASVHIAKDITERKLAEEEIRDIAKFPSENPNPVLRIRKDGKILYGNDAALPLLALWKSKVGGVVPAKWRRLVDLTFESEKAISNEEEVDGRIFSFFIAPVAENDYANMYASDVTERKQAEVELKAAQEKLIDTAHRAGMAEVAADVLHNVGNVLNSINVSTTVIREKVTSSELANLEKVASIINEHIEDLGTFLTEHPQGKHIPVYLTEVSKCLTDEQTVIIDKLKVLADNVQHIKDIVSMQQEYANVSGVEVQTSLSGLAEDAIQINSAGLERHGTRLIREFEELGDVEIDKQKLLQILVNLVSNAKYALSGSDKEEKLLTIRIYKHCEERFRVEVADNGVGISEDNLAKIFSHGFTTKKDGHGVGLHSSALAAKELGGTLTVHSDGLGQGATFTLELPFKSVEVMK